MRNFRVGLLVFEWNERNCTIWGYVRYCTRTFGCRRSRRINKSEGLCRISCGSVSSRDPRVSGIFGVSWRTFSKIFRIPVAPQIPWNGPYKDFLGPRELHIPWRLRPETFGISETPEDLRRPLRGFLDSVKPSWLPDGPSQGLMGLCNLRNPFESCHSHLTNQHRVVSIDLWSFVLRTSKLIICLWSLTSTRATK